MDYHCEQAMNSIDWKLILTLAGGISLGFALQKTGVAGQVANGILSMCGDDSLMVIPSLLCWR